MATSGPQTNLLEQLYSEGYAELYGLSGAHTLAMTNETEVLLQVIDDEAEAGQQVANIPDAVGRTPLMFAALNGSVRAAELLLSKGALVEAKDADGRSAVDWASYHGQSKVLKVLLGKYRKITSLARTTSSAIMFVYYCN